jgi:hypothetical protein
MASEERLWHVPIRPDFRRCGLSRVAQDVMVGLSAKARRKCYCWAGNEDITLLTGLHPDSVKRGLRELDAADWIERVIVAGRRARTRRVGIILLKRPDYPINPVAEGAYGLAEAREALSSDRAAWQKKARGFRAERGPSATPN